MPASATNYRGEVYGVRVGVWGYIVKAIPSSGVPIPFTLSLFYCLLYMTVQGSIGALLSLIMSYGVRIEWGRLCGGAVLCTWVCTVALYVCLIVR